MDEKNKYQAEKIEAKWQKYWQDNDTFKASLDKKKKKFYALTEFPYPSGDGLHTGHLRPNVAMDIISRRMRMEGQNVLFPIGFDSFGLPTENYAIKKNIAPQKVTETNIANFTRQFKATGLSFDWSRSFSTTDEDYYRWTQWIFIQMYNKGLAYKAKENINWCLSCKIGLANEEVVAGKCERCGADITKREREQWILKITDYADRLIDDLDGVNYLQKIKSQQINWIGRSTGAKFIWRIKDCHQKLTVFTSRADTLYGATFMVLAPEHKIIHELENKISNLAEVKKYIKSAKAKTDIERSDAGRSKTGVQLKGLTAINPANDKEVPIFVADYVLASYGTGAIMAVPAHDKRDYEFAKKYGLEIIEVIEPLYRKDDGEDAVRPKKKFVERDAVVCVVKHWTENKYLCLQWKQVDWKGFVIGGIEGAEDAIEAGQREIEEETGFTDSKFVKKLGGRVHAQFYHKLKKENRWARFQGLYYELQSDQNVGISQKEQAIHDVKWLSAQEVSAFLNVPDMHLIWERLHSDQVYSGEGMIINSGEYDGLASVEFKKKIVRKLAKQKLGQEAVNYKLRDWIFSRQRYWGEPIPMIYCNTCGWVTENEKNLPVVLPDIKNFQPTADGDSPLAKAQDWLVADCPKCGDKGRRETDVMPNWAGSNWYFIRFTDPRNNKEMVDSGRAKYWLPVDWYQGGMEHTTLHLLYSRFVWKFLYDIKAIPKQCGLEPYSKRTAHGMVFGEGGIKMSKSKGNVVNPEDCFAKYGVDATRLYIMFMGPFDQDVAWSEQGLAGMWRFCKKVWALSNKVSTKVQNNGASLKIVHQSIRKVTEDIAKIHFNTAVSQLMILANTLDKQEKISQDIFSNFVKLLYPFAPHLGEELWHKLGHKDTITFETWPKHDDKLAREDSITIGIQINGKVRDEIELAFDTEPSPAITKEVLAKVKIKRILAGQEVKKVIHVKNKIINIVAS